MRIKHPILVATINIIMLALVANLYDNYASKPQLSPKKEYPSFLETSETNQNNLTETQQLKYKIPYYPNEAIDFSLKYGIVKVGLAHLEFDIDSSCSNAFIFAEARSSGLVKFFKDVLFRYESCMDTSTGFPISDSRILIEKNYKDINTVYYDRTTRNDSSLVYSDKNYTNNVVPKNIYDLLTGFYHYRTNFIYDNLPDNYVVSITTFFIDEVWELVIRYVGIETVKTKFGNIECLIIKPVTIIGHFFSTTDAMCIWLSNDGRYIPVKFTINLRIGNLYGEITGYNKPICN